MADDKSRKGRPFNRVLDDVSNILLMEHVNVTVPDQATATQFYVNGLGFTRDPYIDWGAFNVWINVGNQQFHLPTSSPQVVRGIIGVVIPDLNALESRLERMASTFSNTKFSCRRLKHYLDVTCPWGNRFRCHAPGIAGKMQLGIAYLEFLVPPDTSEGITRFYEQVFGCHTSPGKGKTVIHAGLEQKLIFRESGRAFAPYDGHHIAIYVTAFSSPHRFLVEHGLITEESDEHQYRFQQIVDPSNGEPLFELEHEVRSLHHPMWNRNLVNRNPMQSFFNYQRDRDRFVPESQ